MNWIKTHKKEFFSFLILFIVMFFLILPGLTYKFDMSGDNWIIALDFPFIIAINALFVCGVYELLKVIFYKNKLTSELNSNEKKNLNKSIENSKNDFDKDTEIIFSSKKRTDSLFWIIFVFIAIIYSTLFLVFSFDYLSNNEIAYNFTTLLFSLFIAFIVLNLLLIFVESFDLQDQLVLSSVTTLLFLFAFGLIYLTIYFSFAVILLVVITTSVSDMSAFMFGKKWGKRKIVSNISPSKTLEGFVLGSATALIFGLAWILLFIFPSYSSSYLILQNKSWLFVVIVLLTVVFAPLGDLFFSKIKRNYQIKDFSNLIPGHGGLLDRIDSHIFTISITTIILAMVVI